MPGADRRLSSPRVPSCPASSSPVRLSSLFVAVMLLESGVRRRCVILYVAAVMLGFILVPNKPAVIPYAFFFGYYGILNFY